MLDVSDRQEGVVAILLLNGLLKTCSGLEPLQDANPVPTSLLADDLATAPLGGARCSSVVRAFAHGVMGHRIDPSWCGPIELFLVPASVRRLV